MKLIRYTYPPSQASGAFNRLLNLGAPATGRFSSLFDDFLGTEAGFTQPAVDLYEDEHNFYALFELPGLGKDKINLELENAALVISRQEVSEEDAKVFRAQFRRSIPLPDGVDQGKISAGMKDGILTVTMPKAEAGKPRQISIQ